MDGQGGKVKIAADKQMGCQDKTLFLALRPENLTGIHRRVGQITSGSAGKKKNKTPDHKVRLLGVTEQICLQHFGLFVWLTHW